jgi:hypothetical protein
MSIIELHPSVRQATDDATAYQARLAKELFRLEPMINDLARWASIGRIAAYHDAENPKDPLGSLGLVVAEQVDKLALELRTAFYAAVDGPASETAENGGSK